MRQLALGHGYTGLFAVLFGTGLVLLSTLRTSDTRLRWAGGLAILALICIAILLLCFYFLQVGRLPRVFRPFLANAGLLVTAYVVSGVVSHSDIRGLVIVAELVAVIAFVSAIAIIRFSSRDCAVAGSVILVWLVAMTASWLMSGTPVPFRGYLSNPNSMGALALTLSYPIWMLPKWLSSIGGGLVVLLMVASRARSSWLALGAIVITYLLWPKIIKSRRRFSAYFVVAIGFVIALAAAYIALANSPEISAQLNKLSLEYTGKRFFSGRPALWEPILTYIRARPMLGYGAGVALTDIGGSEDLSAHSLYLQVAAQAGLVGLLALIATLFRLWSILWYGKSNSAVRIAASYFMGVLIHQNFEVTLTQNNLAVGIAQWLVIGIGIATSIAEQNRSSSSTERDGPEILPSVR